MLKFHSLEASHGPGAIQAIRRFANGWYVSVIRNNCQNASGSYGNRRGEGLFELGVFIHADRSKKSGRRLGPGWHDNTLRLMDLGVRVKGVANYDEIAGWLTIPDCEQIMRRVAQLPSVGRLVRLKRQAKRRHKRNNHRNRRARIRASCIR